MNAALTFGVDFTTSSPPPPPYSPLRHNATHPPPQNANIRLRIALTHPGQSQGGLKKVLPENKTQIKYCRAEQYPPTLSLRLLTLHHAKHYWGYHKKKCNTTNTLQSTVKLPLNTMERLLYRHHFLKLTWFYLITY